MCEPSVAPAAAVDHFNPRTDLALVIIVVAASTASNVSLIANLHPVVVKLVLGVRRAVAEMKVVIASWIRVTAALEVVPVALPIPEALATADIAVV